MRIRKASLNDVKELQELYFGTITTINTKDYNAAQIAAWASTADGTESLKRKIIEQHFYVAEKNNIITGFASLENSGHLDMMYTHKNYQNRGIAKALLNKILEKARSLGIIRIDTDASITAKPFFEKQGFKFLHEQTVYTNNISLINYKMELCAKEIKAC